MFRALYAHHQEAELHWCSIWYRPLSQCARCTGWQGTGSTSSLPTCAPDALTERTIPDAASMQFSLLMMSMYCSKHVKECNKYTAKYSNCASRWSLSTVLKCLYEYAGHKHVLPRYESSCRRHVPSFLTVTPHNRTRCMTSEKLFSRGTLHGICKAARVHHIFIHWN